MISFPNEIIFNIFYYINDPKDFICLSQTTQLLHSIGNDQNVSKSLVGELYGYENERYSFYTNLVSLVKSENTSLLVFQVGNFKYVKNFYKPITKFRMSLIESCRNDNPKTFLELVKKIRTSKLNRFIVKKLLKVICKNNSLETASHFFKLFPVSLSPTLVRNEKIFEIFWKGNTSYDFLELIYYLCKCNAISQFKLVITDLIKNDKNLIKRFIDNIVMNIKYAEFLTFLLNVLPIEIFKVRRCDILSKMLELKMFDEFLNFFHVFSSTDHLDYSILSSLFKYNVDAIQKLFTRYPKLSVSLNELGFKHCFVFLSSSGSHTLKWHEAIFQLIQHFDPKTDHLGILMGLQKKTSSKIVSNGSQCWLRMMNQSNDRHCKHCEQLMNTIPFTKCVD
jgi:hypothetical protein